MSVYFSYFPKIKYDGRVARDITRRNVFRSTVFADPYAFLPYMLESDDRPEDVAHFYYGNVSLTWLVYFSNQIVDPYFDWPMSSRDFDRYIINKYEEQANTTGYAVLAWTQNTLIDDNIVEYRNNDEPEIVLSPDTYRLDTSLLGSEWSPIRVYDYESELNDNKRSILLLDRKYTNQALEEMKELLNG